MNHRTIAVIPARYGSTRFPGKPLALIQGRPMIQWCYESVRQCDLFQEVIVATDDERIMATVASFGGQAVMTSPDHPTGTDRIAEAIQGRQADLIVNVQGDEPLVPATVLEELVRRMQTTKAEMGTAAVPFNCTSRDPNDHNAVKVVIDKNGFALYFSRSLIPFPRAGGTPMEPLLHWGLYAYRRDFLETFITLERSQLEECEMLEQLRALEHGARILVVKTDAASAGVDTPEDLQAIEELLRKNK